MAFSFKWGKQMHQQDGESRRGYGAGGSAGTPGRRGRTLVKSAAVVLGIALLGATLTAPSAAAKPGAQPQAPTGNCVVALGAGSAGAATTTCYATFTDAISVATNGAVTNAPANAADALNDKAFQAQLESTSSRATKSATGSARVQSASSLAASYLLSIEYDLSGYNGLFGSYTFTGASPCTGSFSDVDYSFILPTNWWDRISSFRSYNVCWVDHHYWSNFGSPHSGYFPSQSPMPVVGGINYDNNARAIRWT